MISSTDHRILEDWAHRVHCEVAWEPTVCSLVTLLILIEWMVLVHLVRQLLLRWSPSEPFWTSTGLVRKLSIIVSTLISWNWLEKEVLEEVEILLIDIWSVVSCQIHDSTTLSKRLDEVIWAQAEYASSSHAWVFLWSIRTKLACEIDVRAWVNEIVYWNFKEKILL
jgi:hypothetical protein